MAQLSDEIFPLRLHWPLNEETLFDFCQINSDYQIERTAQGDIEIMPPTGGETGYRNTELITELNLWARQDNTGIVFDSSTGFRLDDGSICSPDVSWVTRKRLRNLTLAQKRQFLPLAPDFVIELQSATDRLERLQAKMQLYLTNGVLLGWLIMPEKQGVYIYQPNQIEYVDKPDYLNGEPILKGFILNMHLIWETSF